jgi:hypothetical protein
MLYTCICLPSSFNIVYILYITKQKNDIYIPIYMPLYQPMLLKFYIRNLIFI